jgi:plastocyanin
LSTRTGLAALVAALGLAAPVAAYEAGPVEQAGAIEGAVTFGGPVPPRAAIAVDPDHQAHCGADMASEALVVDPATRGVRFTVVHLESIEKGKKPARTGPARLDNRGCVFVPHVTAVMIGDTLRVRNDDPVVHNIRARVPGETRTHINVVQPTQGQETDREVRRPGVMALSCDTHPHMHGWLLAFPHPYFAVTDASGRFRLDDVPPGTYRVVAWHEGWRLDRIDRGRPVYDAPVVLAESVTVPPGGTARVDFTLRAR